jgi:PAS domain S-box-containing protein
VLIENAAVLLFYLNLDGKIVLCNKRAQTVLGLKREEIIGQDWLRVLFREEENALRIDMFKAVLDDASTYKRAKDFECHIRQRGLGLRLISWNITPIDEGILLLGQDITQAQERKNSLKNIDESLKNIISSINEYALYVINLDGLITYFGMGCEKMFGYAKSQVIFKHVGILHNFNKAAFELNMIFEQLGQSGRYESEIELLAKSGNPLPVRLTVNRFLDHEGKLTGYVFIAKDITETKKLEYQVFQAEKLAALGQLSAGMAHEINNPLFVVSGRLQILKAEKLKPAHMATIDLIDSQVNRIRKLVDRVLKFSRKSILTPVEVDINQLIEQAITLVSYNKSTAVCVKIEKSFEKGLPKISGDPDQLQEVFLNLMINAYQAMPKGGILKVVTRNFENLYAQVKISDTGVGIPAENFKNIFMPFFSTYRFVKHL